VKIKIIYLFIINLKFSFLYLLINLIFLIIDF